MATVSFSENNQTRNSAKKRAQVIVASCGRRSLEIEQIKAYLSGNGYSVSRDAWDVDPKADLILLSTCGFTKAAEDAGFDKYHEIVRKKKPDAKIVFGGCIPEINPERTLRKYGEETFSPQTYERLNDILGTERRIEEFKRPNEVRKTSFISSTKKAIELLKTFDGSMSGLAYISRRISNEALKHLIRSKYAHIDNEKTFFIQIQEGCSMGCSFCVIPKAIGPLRSKPMAKILGEFRAGLDKGFRRFQLVGDNAGSYGLDIGTNLGHLLDQITAMKEQFLMDLTDINPVYMRLIYSAVRNLNDQKRLDRLYIPIQSGNPRILKLMRRHCDMDAVKKMLIGIRQNAHPDFKMGTSVIVGFPSETVDELYDTVNYCRDVQFDWVWCHSFSVREGAPAGKVADVLNADEVLRRAQFLKSELTGISRVTTAEDTKGSKTCQG